MTNTPTSPCASAGPLAVVVSPDSPASRLIANALAEHTDEAVFFSTTLDRGWPSDVSQRGPTERFVAQHGRGCEPYSLANGHAVLRAVMAIRRACRRLRPRAILTIMGTTNMLVSRAVGVERQFVFCGGSEVLRTRSIKALVTRKLLNHADLVWSNGPAITDRLSDWGVKRVITMPHGIDCGPLLRIKKRPIDTDGTVSVLVTRGFDSVYNNLAIVHSLPFLQRIHKIRNITFAAPGPHLSEARRAVARMPPGIREHVSFLGGYDSRDLPDLLSEHDVYVSMSTSDGLSTSLLEAQAAGLYPVVSDIAANRYWFGSQPHGAKLVPLGNPRTLAAILDGVVDAPGDIQGAIASNRRHVGREADIHSNVPKFISLMTSAAQETRSHSEH